MVETTSVRDGYSEQLQQHLRSVLRSRALGLNHADYNGLVQEMQTLKSAAFLGGSESAQHDLSSLLDTVNACISALHEHRHSMLIAEVLSINLWQAAQELRCSVLNFMLHLAVVNSTLSLQILQSLVLNLSLPWAVIKEQAEDLAKEWQPIPKAEAVQNDIIATLGKLLELVPVSVGMLPPILARGLPYKVLARCFQCSYLRAMLLIAELPKAAPIRKQILAAVVQHLISLDVEIRWQDIAFSLDEEEDEVIDQGEESEEDDIFELEGQGEEVQLDPSKFESTQAAEVEAGVGSEISNRITGRSGFEGKASDEQPSTSGREQTDETAEKLDSMMSQVFQHIDRCRQRGELAATWQALLDSFFTTVLNTHRSKFTQYLLWYILNMDTDKTSNSFLGGLLSILADARQPAITRSAAASYVASFLARAAFLSDAILMDHITRVACWCLQYCQRHETQAQALEESSANGFTDRAHSEAPPQGVVHQVFYAACQGLLYTLCYRLEQLKQSQDTNIQRDLQHLFQQVIPFLLQSRLAPMAICLPTVVTEFTKLSARFGLLDCKPFNPSWAEAAQAQRPLEMFFPFDPYLLRRSAVFLDLKHTFLRWKGGHAEAEEDDGADGNESDVSSEDELEGSEASSSGLSSSSGGESSGAESENEELAEAFQDLTPAESSPVAVWQTMSQRIGANEPATHSLAASLATDGTSSPPAPMSWTARAPQGFSQHRQALGSSVHAHN